VLQGVTGFAQSDKIRRIVVHRVFIDVVNLCVAFFSAQRTRRRADFSPCSASVISSSSFTSRAIAKSYSPNVSFLSNFTVPNLELENTELKNSSE
jgi:hypothetical protein